MAEQLVVDGRDQRKRAVDLPQLRDEARLGVLTEGLAKQAIDASCRRELKRKIPGQLPGLEALLKVFQ